MEVQSILANRIDAAGDMISYDEAVKKVLANKYILAWILKSCMEEYEDTNISEIAERYIEGDVSVSREAVHMDERTEFIEGTSNESTSVTENRITYDIKFRAITPNMENGVDLVINVEAQNDFYPGYPIEKRGVYYVCRMISEQYGTVFGDSDYGKIKKAASIWICTNPPGYRKNTIARYALDKKDIAGQTPDDKKDYDLINVVMVCLGGKEKPGYDGLLKMLDVLLSQDMEAVEKKRVLGEEFGIPMTRKLEGGLEEMCNLSKGVYSSGYDSGYGSGYDKARADDIKKMMHNKGWEIDECMDVLEIPADKREMYRQAVLADAVTA